MELNKITKSFKDNKVLMDINFKFEKGKIYCINGKNGSGKSTLFKIITGLLKPDSGFVKTDSKPFGLIEEASGFNYLTAEEQFEYIFGKSKEKDLKLKKIASMLDFEECLNIRFGKMSQGMKQKVALIYAFYSDADYLLLDEPTSNLDSFTCDRLKNIIFNEVKNGRTIIISSHDSYFVKDLNGINVLLEDGKLKEIKELNDFIDVKIEASNHDFSLYLENHGIKYNNDNDCYALDCKLEFIKEIIDFKNQFEIKSIKFDCDGDIK